MRSTPHIRTGKRTTVGGRVLQLMAAFGLAVIMAFAAATPGLAQDGEGVKISRPAWSRKLISAEKLEEQAGLQYQQMTRQAFQKRALAEENDAQLIRLRKIFRDLLPGAAKFNEASKTWRWEVNLLRSNQINAFCMPGGKIAFFSGILDKLQLNDDEVAMVMGHEIGHALYEHARARAVKSTAAVTVSRVVGGLLFGNAGDVIGAQAGNLIALKFSRNDELQADLIGMELAARAGYDPRAGVTLWQKMSQASGGAPPQWMSTHPAGQTRINTIRKHLPEVMGLYERSRQRRPG
jgi:Zn-dependent protease with chaperone function